MNKTNVKDYFFHSILYYIDLCVISFDSFKIFECMSNLSDNLLISNNNTPNMQNMILTNGLDKFCVTTMFEQTYYRVLFDVTKL